MNNCHSKSPWETQESHFGLRIWRQVWDFSLHQRSTFRGHPSFFGGSPQCCSSCNVAGFEGLRTTRQARASISTGFCIQCSVFTQYYPCLQWGLSKRTAIGQWPPAADAILELLGVWKPLQEGLSQVVEATGNGEAESLALPGCESAVSTGIWEADLTETAGEGG